MLRVEIMWAPPRASSCRLKATEFVPQPHKEHCLVLLLPKTLSLGRCRQQHHQTPGTCQPTRIRLWVTGCADMALYAAMMCQTGTRAPLFPFPGQFGFEEVDLYLRSQQVTARVLLAQQEGAQALVCGWEFLKQGLLPNRSHYQWQPQSLPVLHWLLGEVPCSTSKLTWPPLWNDCSPVKWDKGAVCFTHLTIFMPASPFPSKQQALGYIRTGLQCPGKGCCILRLLPALMWLPSK